MTDIQKRVYGIIHELEGGDMEIADDSLTLLDDLGFDSLDTVEIAIALEQEFGIEIPDADYDIGEAGHFKTVGDIVHYMQRRLELPI